MKARWIGAVGIGMFCIGGALWSSRVPTTAPPNASAILSRTHPRPPPTEHWFERVAEGTQKRNRKAWFAELHQAADGVD